MPDFRLDDAEARALAYGFRIPSREERESLVPGDFAELVFIQDDEGAERVWVEVAEVAEGMPGRYIGALAHEPRFLRDLATGDTVTFSARHVTNIERAPAGLRNGYDSELGRRRRRPWYEEIFRMPEPEEEPEKPKPGARSVRKRRLPGVFEVFRVPEREEEKPAKPAFRRFEPGPRGAFPAAGLREWSPGGRPPAMRSRMDPGHWFDLGTLWQRARAGRRTAGPEDAVPLQVIAEKGRDQNAQITEFFGVEPGRAFLASLERALNDAMPRDLPGFVEFGTGGDGAFGLFYFDA